MEHTKELLGIKFWAAVIIVSFLVALNAQSVMESFYEAIPGSEQVVNVGDTLGESLRTIESINR